MPSSLTSSMSFLLSLSPLLQKFFSFHLALKNTVDISVCTPGWQLACEVSCWGQAGQNAMEKAELLQWLSSLDGLIHCREAFPPAVAPCTFCSCSGRDFLFSLYFSFVIWTLILCCCGRPFSVSWALAVSLWSNFQLSKQATQHAAGMGSRKES